MNKRYRQLETLVNGYFDMCDMVNSENEKKITKPYTIAGFLCYTGLTREDFQTLLNKAPYNKLLMGAKMKIEAYIEEKSLTGELSCNASQGSLKYNFGWGEKNQVKEESLPVSVEVVLCDEAKELAN